MTAPASLREEDEVSVDLPDDGLRITQLVEYSFNSHFLVPTDGWSVTVADPTRDRKLRAALLPGKRVTFSINGHVNSSGFIDKRTISGDRENGTIIRIDGRDRLGQAVSGHVDPKLRFTTSMSLLDMLRAVFAPYGWSREDQFAVSDEANLNIITGSKRGIRRSPRRRRPLKSVLLHQLKPYPKEGAFSFASRVSQRHGLWIWTSADGETLIVDKPSFDQDPRYTISRRIGDDGRANTILSGDAPLDNTEQPSIIIATGYGSGAEFPHARLKVAMVNPFVTADVTDVLERHKDALIVKPDYEPASPLASPIALPVYLHDDESQTIEQLTNFVRREMSLRMHHQFHGQYVVRGHSMNGSVWAVNTIVDVADEIADVAEPLWILSRTFLRNRSSGIRTHIDVIRPGSIAF